MGQEEETYHTITLMNTSHSNCTNMMTCEYPAHKTSLPQREDSHTEMLTTSYNRDLLPHLPLTLSHSRIPFAAPSPFLPPLSSVASSLSVAAVSKQLKHLQGVTSGPHAPPNAVSAGGRRQR